MKIKRLFAAILTALMVVSAFSFTANAQDTTTVTPIAVTTASSGWVTGGCNTTEAIDKCGWKTNQYDADNDVVFRRFTAPEKSVSDQTGNSSNFFFQDYSGRAVNKTSSFVIKAYMRSTFEGTPYVTADNTVFKAINADGTDYTATPNKWEKVYFSGTLGTADGKISNCLFRLGGNKAISSYYDEEGNVVDWVDLAGFAYFNTMEEAVAYEFFVGDPIEDPKAVYISANGNDANDGRHSKNAVKTMSKAMELMKADGIDTLYVVGDVDGTGTDIGASEVPGVSGKKIYIQGYSGDGTEVLSYDGHYKYKGDVEYKNITVYDIDAGDGQHIAQGYDITFGENVIIKDKDGTSGRIAQGYYNSFNNINNTVRLNSGTWARFYYGAVTGSTITGNTEYIIDGTANVKAIYVGHGSGTSTQVTKGTTKITINGGTIAIDVGGSQGNMNSLHQGLRYYTLNGGTVSSFYTRSNDTYASYEGITVYEINKGVTITPETIGETSGTTDDSETRVVIFNDGFDAIPVGDTGAYVLDVTGANLSADVTVASDYTATLNGYTYELDDDSYDAVKIGDKEIKLDTLTNGVIPASEFKAGVNTVEFKVAEAEEPELAHIAAYRAAGYEIIYVTDVLTTPVKENTAAGKKVVFALTKDISLTGSLKLAHNGGTFVITSAGGKLIINNNSVTLGSDKNADITFDNIAVNKGAGERGINAYGNNLTLTETFTTTSTDSAALYVNATCDGGDSGATNGNTLTIETPSKISVRCSGWSGNFTKGNVNYVFGKNANASLIVAGKVGKEGVQAELQGNATVVVKDNAKLSKITLAESKSYMTGSLDITIKDNAEVGEIQINAAVGGNANIDIQDGTVGNITFTSGKVAGKAIVKANTDKATVGTISGASYAVKYNGNLGGVAYSEDYASVVLTPNDSVKYVRLTNGDTVKEYDVAGNEVDLLAELTLALNAGVTTVEFLTEGTLAPTTANAVFNANGGAWGEETTKTVVTNIGEVPVAPASPVKEGFTFKGWTPELTAITAEGATYTAVWEENAPTTATLKFYDGDTLFVEKTVAIGATLDILPLMSDVKGSNHATYTNDILARPSKKGYKLVGWATTNGGEAVTVTANADASYYAVWEEVNELTAGEDFTLTIVDGTEVTASPVPADAISFIRGDDKNSFGVNSDGVKYYDTTVTDLSAYGVSFVAGKTTIGSWYGGSDSQKTVLKPDGTKSIWYKWNDSYLSAKPGVEGEYNVAYWIYTGSEGSTRAFTLDAPGKSGVVYLDGAGTKDHFVQFKATLTADSELKYSAALDFDDNTVKGAQLLGIYIWKDAPVVTTANATFNANGGAWGEETTKTVVTTIGEVPVAPEVPTKAGYTFAGWTPELTAITAEGATYTAKWEVSVRTFENAVYLGNAGADTNDGLTPATLVKTLKRVQELVLANKDIDTIVVVGTYSKSNESSSSTNDFLKGANRKITITGQTVESVFDMKYGSSDSHLRLGNDIEFNNLKINASSGDGGIMSMGYELTFGEGMTINSQKAGFLHYNAQLKDNGVVNVYSGTIGRLDLGVQSGQTWRGTSTINVYGGAVGAIRNGHGWKGEQWVYGINNVNVNGGVVGPISLTSTADTAVTSYAGLRYFTINAGTVGDIETVGSSLSKKYAQLDKNNQEVKDENGNTIMLEQTADVRAGVTVVEYNGGTIGTIKPANNKQTGAAEDDDATRVVILNNGMTATVKDAKAIVVKPVGAKLHAATNAQETYPADRTKIDSNWGRAIVLKGFTYELPAESTANAVKIDGGEAILLENYANGIITGVATAGEHTIEFVTVEITEPEATNKVYLDQTNGNDENNGETAASAVKTIAAAQALLGDEDLDTLVIVGQFLLPDDDAKNTLGYAGKTITITGFDSSAVFAIDNDITGGSKWNDERLPLAGAVVFENITIIGDENDARIELNGNNFTFGDGVKFSQKSVNENNTVSVAVQSIPAGKTPEITVKSGTINRLLTGPFNAGTVSGTVNINVAGKDAFVQAITIAHNYNANNSAKYGITNVTVDDGAVSTIGLTPTGTVSVANYDGLRHYVINGGSVANIELAGIKTKTGTISGKESTKTATLQSGVNVVEINGGAVGKIYRSASDIDDSVSAIIFNNGTYAEGIVTDTTAIVADVKGGTLTAQTTAPYAADATAAQIQEWSKTVAITGYAFTTDKKFVYINDVKHEVSEFVADAALAAEEVSGVIPADKLTVGYNSVTFSDVEMVVIKFVIGDTVTEATYAVGDAVEFPEVTAPAPTKDEYYVFDCWMNGYHSVDTATFTAPEGGATLEASFKINAMPELAYKNYSASDFSQVNNVAGVFTRENATIDGVEAVKIIPGTEGNATTTAINIEGSGRYPSNYSTGVDGTVLDPAIYEYAVYRYYYVPGTNTETRKLAVWYQKHPWEDTTLVAADMFTTDMEAGKWTYVVDKMDRADGKTPDLSIQFHIRPMNEVKASVLAANGEYVYIDSMYLFQAEPTVATVTFKGEDGAVLYAIDALNSEAVRFGGTAPEKADHEFLGWAVEGTTEVVDTFAFAEDTTLVPVFKSTVVEPETTAKYKTYGVYDAEAGTYTVELKLTGVKAHMGSFGFVLPGLVSVTAAEGVTLFAEEETTGAVVSPIFDKGEDYYANTWAIEQAPGYIDATNEEVLIATFVLEADASFPDKFLEYVVANADAKYYKDGHYLVAPKDDALATSKVAVIYEAHTDSIKEIVEAGPEYKTYGTYNVADGSYTIEVKFVGGKINAGAFGIAFAPEYMTYDPEANGAFALAEGIANYLGVTLTNTADGIAFVWDGSADAENGYVDATDEEVLIATIKATMTEEQRSAYVAANAPAFELLDISKIADAGLYFNGTDYLVALYADDLAIERVPAEYTAHADDEVEITTADVAVKVTFADKVGATVTNIGYITVGENEAVVIDGEGNTDATVEYVINDATVGETLTIVVEKNGYIKVTAEVKVSAAGNTVEITTIAGDIKETTDAVCGNGTVDLSDFIRVVRGFDEAYQSNEGFMNTIDVNEDGAINVTDLGIIKANFNKTAANATVEVR